MKLALHLIGLALLTFGFNAQSAWAEPAQVTHRVALVVGANDGGKGRAVLRYAVKDANTFSSVLRELGGLEAQNLFTLDQPNTDDLFAGLNDLGRRVQEIQAKSDAQENHRAEMIFYYSGHSDERGLLLGEQLVEYQILKDAIDGLSADVRIVVLDSCSSGVLTRLKGGTHQSAFLVDESSKVEGHAFLTSASADESAQESDAVGGSFFTHFLVMGMRGAADTSSDGKVTLSEVYKFAFDETLRRTARTQSGPQHASYDFQLSGTGDLVMTDLRVQNAGITFAKEYGGRVFVHSLEGDLIAEMQKREGKVMKLRVPSGAYDIYLEKGETLSGAQVFVPDDGVIRLEAAQLESRTRLPTVARGGTKKIMVASDLPAGAITFTPQELMEQRERGEMLLYSGIGSAGLGSCCLLAGSSSFIFGAFINDGISFDSGTWATLGCALLGGVFTFGGAAVGIVGNNKLKEAKRALVEIEEEALAKPLTSKPSAQLY